MGFGRDRAGRSGQYMDSSTSHTEGGSVGLNQGDIDTPANGTNVENNSVEELLNPKPIYDDGTEVSKGENV
ncbi:hypothetical protein ACOSP7_024747 [Xanthoceras sorbifolium]